jgi:hypothetical protein
MNLGNFDGLGWLLLLIGPLFIIQRLLHREIQGLLLILTRRPSVTIIIFSILFFPGVLLHELSHFLMARLLGVRTGRISLFPRPLKNGRLRLGFVETGTTDFVRDSLIGTAPLLTGVVAVALIGIYQMGLMPLGNALLTGQFSTLPQELQHLPKLPDFWVWFFLVFVISSTMLSSPSDRRAWLPLLITIIALLVIGLVIGLGPWLAVEVAPTFNRIMRTLALVFGMAIVIHLAILLPVGGVRLILSKFTGLSIK